MRIVVLIIVIVELLLIGIVSLLLKRTARKNKMSFQETLDLTELPIITFYNNGKKLNFLLDTGANHSVIDEEWLKECTYEKTNMQCEFMGIDGNNKQAQDIVRMSIKKGKMTYSELFQVANLPAFKALKDEYGVQVHGVLGNTFFTVYSYVLDFDDMVAYTK